MLPVFSSHNSLLVTQNLFKKFLLRIAIAFSAGRQLNNSKHISTTSCDLMLKISLNVLLMT